MINFFFMTVKKKTLKTTKQFHQIFEKKIIQQKHKTKYVKINKI